MANSISSSSSNTIPSSKTTINDLPQHLLIHILTFLYLPEAIGASLISRSFRNLWHFLPSLHFDIEEFYSRSTSPDPPCDHTRKLFAYFVSQTLNFRQPNPLTKLKLTFEYTNWHEHKYNVQSWILYAINLSVSELVLDFDDEFIYRFDKWEDPDDDDDAGPKRCNFDFYLADIAKTCIKVLNLNHLSLIFPLETNPMKFVSLKSLTLEAISIPSLSSISYLLPRFVNLETLKLVEMEVNEHDDLRIHSNTLKELFLEWCWSGDSDLLNELDICCPRLEKIGFVRLDVGKYTIKDTELLAEAWFDQPVSFDEKVKPWEKMLSYFTNIPSLQVWEELLESNEVPPGCERYASNVKHLELNCSYNENDLVGIAALLKLLPKLEILGLDSRCTREENLHLDYRKASTVACLV